MSPFHHLNFHSHISSIDIPSSFGEEDEKGSRSFSRDDHNLIDFWSSTSNCYHNEENYDPKSRQRGINSNFSLRMLKRANVGDAAFFRMQEHDNLTVLQPSQVSNVAGKSTMHVMKRGGS